MTDEEIIKKDFNDKKRKFLSRIKNYTENSEVHKKFERDFDSLIQKVLSLCRQEQDENVKKLKDKTLSILKEGCGIDFTLEDQDVQCGEDFEDNEGTIRVILCEICKKKIEEINSIFSEEKK
jgi:hypothetical protein